MNVAYRTPVGNKPIVDTFYEESGLTFGLSAKQIYDALVEIEMWKDRQLNNIEDRTDDYINYCHEQIVKINEWLKRNGYEH